MRIEIHGAQVTDTVFDVLDTLQNDRAVAQHYIDTLDRLTRALILDIDSDDDAATMADIRALQLLRRDLLSLAMPPDADDPADDTPTASF